MMLKMSWPDIPLDNLDDREDLKDDGFDCEDGNDYFSDYFMNNVVHLNLYLHLLSVLMDHLTCNCVIGLTHAKL